MSNSQSTQLSAEEKRIVESQARLRHLGAKHILASSAGPPMASPPTTTVPATAATREDTTTPCPEFDEEVDFDDVSEEIKNQHTDLDENNETQE